MPVCEKPPATPGDIYLRPLLGSSRPVLARPPAGPCPLASRPKAATHLSINKISLPPAVRAGLAPGLAGGCFVLGPQNSPPGLSMSQNNYIAPAYWPVICNRFQNAKSQNALKRNAPYPRYPQNETGHFTQNHI